MGPDFISTSTEAIKETTWWLWTEAGEHPRLPERKARGGQNPISKTDKQHDLFVPKTENHPYSTVVASPRPYSRMYQTWGSNGFANKYPYEGMPRKAMML